MGNAAKMKAAIYSPYWQTLGGGEYYAASVAKVLEEVGYEVHILSEDDDTVTMLNDRFHLGLTKSSVNKNAFKCMQGNIVKKWLTTRKYDVIFFVSDGSIPFLFGRRNLLHFQVPFSNQLKNQLMTKWKLKTITTIVCNSKFTKQIIDREFQVDSQVIYPAVQAIPVGGKKQKIILSVGRFDGNQLGKRQDILIDAFKKLQLPGWTLILAGGVTDPESRYLTKLRAMSKGQSIVIEPNCSRSRLEELYQNATIYWHAHGYGIDTQKSPESTEHFGIAVVEALSAGAIPVVYKAGGVPEIVDDQVGYLWTTIEELVEFTKQAMKKVDDKVYTDKRIRRSQQFSKGVFDEKLKKAIG